MRKQPRFQKISFTYIKNISYLKKLLHSDKSNHIFLKNIKKKGNLVLDTFLDFAEFSSYLAFKISAWEKDCAISFELQIQLHISSCQGGTAGDSSSIQNNWKYTTKDEDNGEWYYRNCAKDLGLRKGGWWHECCVFSAL